VNVEALGAEIKSLRQQLGIRQNELAKGICHQSEISRIESGKIYPRVDVLNKIALKLRVSVQYFLSILSNERNEYINETIEYILFLNRIRRFQEIYELTNSELKMNGNLHNEYFNCFLLWQNTIAKSKLNKMSFDKSIEILIKLTESNNLFLRENFLDLRILNSIAIMYAENHCFEKSLVFHKTILDTDVKSEQYPIFKSKVIYNYSKSLYILGRYTESINTIKQGLKICKDNCNIEMLGYLFLQLGECEEKLPNKNIELEIAKNYYKALVCFGLLDIEESVREVKNKKKYFLDLLSVDDLFNENLSIASK
jgi:HTH-type transcriptional regulator, pleiotropic regulator of extracellular virulence genes